MTGAAIAAARAEVLRLERELGDARANLRDLLRAAQEDGASIRQLQEWSGYSRRNVFNLLR